jgi:hypothetical protein
VEIQSGSIIPQNSKFNLIPPPSPIVILNKKLEIKIECDSSFLGQTICLFRVFYEYTGTAKEKPIYSEVKMRFKTMCNI